MEYYGTLGKACDDRKILREMFGYGMTGVRLNLAHQSLNEASLEIGRVFKAAEDEGVKPDLLIDLQGPELRVGEMKKPQQLHEGKTIHLGSGKGDVPVPQTVMDLLFPGREILIDDGRIKIHIEKVSEKNDEDGPHIVSASGEIIRGGMLASRKNIMIPDQDANMPTLTKQDKNQLRLVKQYGVTGVMQSFVRGAGDIQLLKEELHKNDADDVRIFAKIESRSGYEHIGEIVEQCDMVVIARGDLGSTYHLWELPRIQKEIAQVCNRLGKPFMIATELLHSMEKHAIPTRAEVSDIYNAVLDGASALMLTGETAIGQYPVRSMRFLTKTAKQASMANDPHIKELLDLP